MYLGSNISFTESDINIRLLKAWKFIDWLLICTSVEGYDHYIECPDMTLNNLMVS